MLNFLLRLASLIRSKKIDALIEKLEQVILEKEKNKRLASSLKHSRSIYREKRKRSYY